MSPGQLSKAEQAMRNFLYERETELAMKQSVQAYSPPQVGQAYQKESKRKSKAETDAFLREYYAKKANAPRRPVPASAAAYAPVPVKTKSLTQKLGGVPLTGKQGIMSYLSSGCAAATKMGKNCYRTQRYSTMNKDNTKEYLDCSQYCTDNCEAWAAHFLQNLPDEIRFVTKAGDQGGALIVSFTFQLKTNNNDFVTMTLIPNQAVYENQKSLYHIGNKDKYSYNRMDDQFNKMDETSTNNSDEFAKLFCKKLGESDEFNVSVVLDRDPIYDIEKRLTNKDTNVVDLLFRLRNQSGRLDKAQFYLNQKESPIFIGPIDFNTKEWRQLNKTLFFQSAARLRSFSALQKSRRMKQL